MKLNYLISLVLMLSLAASCEKTPTDNIPAPDETPETPEDDVIVAGYFGGEYYGDYYSPGIGNYYIHLSDNGFDEAGYALPDTVYYTFDLYSTYYGGEEVATLPLPEGTYRLDKDDTFAEGTFSVAYSKYYYTDAAGDVVAEYKFEEGELTVTATEATLVAIIDGKEHKVVFEGIADVADKRSATGEDVGSGDDGGDDVVQPENPKSTLETNYTAVLDHHVMLYKAYGDYYDSGLQNYTFALWPDDYVGDHIQFDVVASTSEDDFLYGTFTIGTESIPYSFFPGEILIEDDETGYMVGSWYYTDDGVTMAPFVDGKLTIDDNGDNTMFISFEVVDDRGNLIIGSWNGMATNLP